MKNALQIYGQLRTFEKSLPSLLKFINYYNTDYDVFLLIDKSHASTYESNSPSNYSMENMYILVSMLGATNLKKIQYTDEFTDAERSQEEYLSKEYQNLWQKFSMRHNNIIKNDFATALKYRTYLLNQMRIQYELQTGIVYDYVIRTRFDWATNIDMIYNINNDTTPILFSDALTIGTPEFVNKEAELGLVYPFTPKCLFDDDCNLLIEKYKKYETWRGDKFIDKHWIFMPELNQRLFLLENSYNFIEAWWKEPSNYGFKIIR